MDRRVEDGAAKADADREVDATVVLCEQLTPHADTPTTGRKSHAELPVFER